MSWKLDDVYYDGATGHVVAKYSHENGAQHRLQVAGGFNSCPHCGHVIPKTNIGDIDIRGLIAIELTALQKAEGQDSAWIRKFNIPPKKAK